MSRPGENEYHPLDELERQEQEEKKKSKLSQRKIFTHNYADREGVSKEEKQIWENPNLVNFFKLMGRKLNQILSVNLMMIFGNFPIFFALFVLSGYASIHSTAPYYAAYAPLRGILYYDASPATAALANIFGLQADITVLSTIDYVLLALAALVVVTFGPVMVGCTYILRNIFRGEGIFLMHDFFYAIRRNLRQAICFGIMDVFILFLLGFDIFFFYLNYGASTVLNMMFFMAIFMTIIYIIMRIYIYLMMVTFDLSIKKMFKNALIFVIVGFKRNLMAFLGIAAVVMLEYFLLALYFPLGVILPFVCLFSVSSMMQVYASYPKIKEIMIDPYYAEHPEEQHPDTLLTEDHN